MSNLPESQMTARNGRTLTPDLTAEVAKVLAAHRQASGFDEVGDYFKYACTCSWSGHSDAAHRDHVATEVTNAVVTALGRPEVVEAAARGITALMVDGKWSDQTPLHFAKVALTVAADELRLDNAAIPEALGAGVVDRG